jgi:hypothetical protein
MASSVQTDKCPFKSKFTDGFVTNAQYITEIFCEHVARQKYADLPNRFWLLPEWLKFYKGQIIEVHKLLRQYSVHTILSSIRDKRCFHTFSMRGGWFIKILKEYHQKEQNKEKLTQSINTNLTEITPQIEFSGITKIQPPFSSGKSGKSNLYKLDL